MSRGAQTSSKGVSEFYMIFGVLFVFCRVFCRIGFIPNLNRYSTLKPDPELYPKP